MKRKYTKDGINEEAGHVAEGIFTFPPHLYLNRMATVKLLSAVAAERGFYFHPDDVKFKTGRYVVEQGYTAEDVDPPSRWHDPWDVLNKIKASSFEICGLPCPSTTVTSVVQRWLDTKFPGIKLTVICNDNIAKNNVLIFRGLEILEHANFVVKIDDNVKSAILGAIHRNPPIRILGTKTTKQRKPALTP